MKLSRILFKPKWQHKNPAVRRLAVVSEQSPDLLAQLDSIARTDEDVAVRLAALHRLNDFELYRERSTADADAEIRRTARERYLALFATNPEPADARIRQLIALEPAELERIAQSAKVSSLRSAALERVHRQAVLIDRAINDPDIELRRTALGRIDDLTGLARIIEKTRKTDKVLNRLARDRAEAIQIAAGDTGVIANRARAICDRLDVLLRAPHAELIQELESIAQLWRALGDRIPDDICNRYIGARSLLESPRPAAASSVASDPEQEAIAVVADVNQPMQSDADGVSESISVPEIEIAIPTAAELEAENARIENRRAEQVRQRELLAKLDETLESLDRSLESGNVVQARRFHAGVQELKAQLRSSLPQSTKQRFEQSEIRYNELARWQQWSNMQRRKQLCQDIESVIETGLHPDALALKIREARAEWNALDAAEGTTNDGKPKSASTGIARRFQALCHNALKPARPYFEKRDELRKSHSEQVEALLLRYGELALDTAEITPVVALKLEAAKMLRSLDRVDPRDRTALAQRLKDAIAVLGEHIKKHEHEVEKAKQRLIEKAQGLFSVEGQAAARQVRDLQKQWQTSGNGQRRVDQEQWKIFHSVCNDVFARLDAARVETAAQQAALASEAQSLVAELEAMSASNEDGLNRARRREIEARWQELKVGDKELHNRYQAALKNIDKAQAQLQRLKKRAHYEVANEAYCLMRALENGTLKHDSAAARWAELSTLAPEFATVLRSRWQRISDHQESPLPTTADSEDIENQARQLLIQFEYLAGLDSPESERQRRMDYQVTRLSARMRGEAVQTSMEQELARLMLAWFELGALPNNGRTDLEARYDKAYSAVLAALP